MSATQFEERMRWMLEEAYRLHGTVHGRFASMLEIYGGVGAARRLMRPEFFELENFYPGEPTLWVETYVADPQFAQLFGPAEIETAKARLEVLGRLGMGAV